jgi:hypothetical protein
MIDAGFANNHRFGDRATPIFGDDLLGELSDVFI